MRWTVAVLLLIGLGVACDRDHGPAVLPEHAINPAMVVSDSELLREQQAISFLFPYDKADVRGWPADPVEQRVVRIVQDSGMRVAFSDMAPGQHHVSVGVKDAGKIPAMRENIAKANLELSPKLRRAFGFGQQATTMP